MSKELKEAFVSNHSGSTSLEVLLITVLPTCVGYDLFLTHSSPSDPYPKRLLLEVVFLVLPVLLSMCRDKIDEAVEGELLRRSGLVELPLPVTASGMLATIAALLYLPRILSCALQQSQQKPSDNTSVSNSSTSTPAGTSISSSPSTPSSPRSAVLTVFRSSVSLQTVVAILFVDFRLFPRRFCKCESSGVGLMDLGAAAAVFAGGCVSDYARAGRGSSDIKTTPTPSASSSLLSAAYRPLVKSCPLLLIGFVRLATTKGLSYQEHASEYGVHWNFFFTLSAVSVLCASLRRVAPRLCLPALVLGLAFYQLALSFLGLQEYVLTADRDGNLLRMNREGVFGCLGYSVLFCVAEDLARSHVWCRASPPRGAEIVPARPLLRLAAAGWAAFWATSKYAGALVSRRSTNAMFLLWATSNCLTLLGLISYVVERQLQRQSRCASPHPFRLDVPPLLSAMNRNGLVVFLLANLLTGAVNLAGDTVEADDTTALVTMIVYVAAVATIAITLDKGFNVTIKI